VIQVAAVGISAPDEGMIIYVHVFTNLVPVGGAHL